jgi:hypothetical protein
MLLGLSVVACGDDGDGEGDGKADGTKIDAGSDSDDGERVETPRGDDLDTCDSNDPCCIDNPDYDFRACTTPLMDAAVPPPDMGDAGMGDDAGN